MKYLSFKMGFAGLLFLFFSASAFAQPVSGGAKEKMAAALDIIKTLYVDTLTDDQLVEQGINGILEELDPHSYYIPADKVAQMNQPLQGNFEGIGIQFNILNDTIMVISPISGGPSEKLGIQAGDKIIAIEGENVAGTGITNEGVRDRLLGEKGSKVNVSIKRRGVEKPIEYTIVRDEIPIYSLDASYMVTPEIGYIKLNRFSATTVSEFKEALDDLQTQGMQDLVLDLRGNGGGYLLAAFELADEFLDRDKMIVYYEGAASPRKELMATGRGEFEDGKLVVLVDEGSASASEIVAGAVQDWDRGLVIGRRSFGKGLVQREFGLPDQSAIRLTVARYYTPTGRSIQKPYSEGLEAYQEEVYHRFETGELLQRDTSMISDSLKYYTPNNRIVYGGGGIMPDIFVPLDTTFNTEFYREVVRQGLVNTFSLEYVDRNRQTLTSSFDNVYELREGFDRQKMFNEFLEYAEANGVEGNQEDIARTTEVLKTQLTALVARNLWDYSAFFEVMNEQNEMLQKAVQVMQDDHTFREMKVQN